jgi:hypothetical protein
MPNLLDGVGPPKFVNVTQKLSYWNKPLQIEIFLKICKTLNMLLVISMGQAHELLLYPIYMQVNFTI